MLRSGFVIEFIIIGFAFYFFPTLFAVFLWIIGGAFVICVICVIYQFICFLVVSLFKCLGFICDLIASAVTKDIKENKYE